MPRKSPPLTVRCWVPDDSGGYKPLESLSPDELAAFRKRNAERIAQTMQDDINARPEAWRNFFTQPDTDLSMQTGA